jgi:hypothetical protein
MQGLWDTIKRPNLRKIDIEEREEGIDNIFNIIMAENFPQS